MDIAITKMSSKGQVVIPAKMREEIHEGEKLIIFKSDNKIIMKKANDMDEKLKEDLIDEMTAVKTDVHLDALLVDGGASANDFLMQFQSDILSLAVKRSAIKESTAMGVAGLAGITTGLFSEQAFRETLQIEKGFKPSMPLPVSQQYYRKWQEAVERSKQWQE